MATGRLTMYQGGAMATDNAVHDTDDVYFAGILLIAVISMMIGLVMGLLIA